MLKYFERSFKMADIKTNLREISVAITAALLIKKINFDYNDLYEPQKLKKLATTASVNCENASNIFNIFEYTEDLKEIIENGYNLAISIVNSNYFKFNDNDDVVWVGYQTQKDDPIDLKIGNYSFSLKEDSFILKNMGLYQFLNDMTGSSFKHGLHVFSYFALDEYDSWFKYTWDNFVNYLSTGDWHFKNSYAKLNKNNKTVTLFYNKLSSTVPFNISSNNEFMKYTCSLTREKVFSKWINNNFSSDEQYLTLKKKCSVEAGRKLANFVNNNYKNSNILNFFRIYKNEYFYAKTTSKKIEILRVPSLSTFNNTIKFNGCKYSVPGSQLNMLTEFENINTHKKLEFRNECRFSHGQFNGTPEAKMYISKNSSLTDLYESII